MYYTCEWMVVCWILLKEVHALHMKFVHKSFSAELVQDHLVESSQKKVVFDMVTLHQTMNIWLTITALLALHVSQSTAWMACEAELCEDNHWQTCIELVLVAMLVVSPLDGWETKSALSGLLPSNSKHRSWLWTFTTPWLMLFLLPWKPVRVK